MRKTTFPTEALGPDWRRVHAEFWVSAFGSLRRTSRKGTNPTQEFTLDHALLGERIFEGLCENPGENVLKIGVADS
ncbi:MAG: hypothetical protein N2C14_18600, partial [Planctomycetales bacterium]